MNWLNTNNPALENNFSRVTHSSLDPTQHICWHEQSCSLSYSCGICNIVFKYKTSMQKHEQICKMKTKTPKKKIKILKLHICSRCRQSFTTQFSLRRHQKNLCTIKDSNKISCFYCKKEEKTFRDLAKHKLKCKHAMQKNSSYLQF